MGGLKQEYLDKIDAIVDKHKDERGPMKLMLHDIQDELGYIPFEAMEKIAETLNVPVSKVYYMLRAMAAAGNYEGALERIREYWGAMLDLGATTFWEDFDMAWLPAGRIDEPVPAGMRDLHRECGAYCYKGFRHSLCHGWASGPTAWLTEYVLGVGVVEPGCRRLRIDPHLGDLEWVEGTFPTPYGVVKIRHEKAADGTVKSRVETPRGVKAELVKHNR